jgi:hypothetical protein
MARGVFNCNTGLAPYAGSTTKDLNCAWNPVPRSALPAGLWKNYSYSPYNPYYPIGRNLPDTDWYITLDAPITS